MLRTGIVLFRKNVYEEQVVGSVVELQAMQDGARLLLASTAGKFNSIQLWGPVLPQQANCSR